MPINMVLSICFHNCKLRMIYHICYCILKDGSANVKLVYMTYMIFVAYLLYSVAIYLYAYNIISLIPFQKTVLYHLFLAMPCHLFNHKVNRSIPAASATLTNIGSHSRR
jgi:hypothetical protein